MNALQNTSYHGPSPLVSSCHKLLSKIQLIKRSLLDEARDHTSTSDRMVRLALNEAEALAGQTGFPLLTFPVLAREKVDAVAAWQSRQKSVRRSIFRRFAA